MWMWSAPTEIGGPAGENVMNLDLGRSGDLGTELEAVSSQPSASALTLRWVEIDAAVLALVPHDVAVLYQLIPIRLSDGELWVATASASDGAGADAVATLTRKVVRRLLGTPEEIRSAINRHYRSPLYPTPGVAQFGAWFSRSYGASDIE